MEHGFDGLDGFSLILSVDPSNPCSINSRLANFHFLIAMIHLIPNTKAVRPIYLALALAKE
jgi:hypothetical protein